MQVRGCLCRPLHAIAHPELHSEMDEPHPFSSPPTVRNANRLRSDRPLLAEPSQKFLRVAVAVKKDGPG